MREGTYQAASRRPSAIRMPTSSCGIPSEASWISQRGACVMSSALPNGITKSRYTRSAPPSHPAVCRAMRTGERRAEPAAASAVTPDAISSDPAGDHPDAGDVAPVGPGVDDVQAVRDDAEPDRERAGHEREPEAGGPRQARLEREPRGRDEEDRRDPGHRGGRAGDGEVEQVQRDEREPARQERALPAGDPPPPPAPPRARRGGSVGGSGGGHS